MDSLELSFTPATELAALMRARQLSPVEVVDAILERIDAVNPKINAYVTLVPEKARAAAREAEAALLRGDKLGPLHGVPVSVKDVIDTAGIRTTYASTLFADHVPTQDDLAVARLKAAGAIVVGKTNTPEFAAGINSRNALFGATRNPWHTSLCAGGSSGGAAAALAAGLAPLAVGSDLGGSLRIPASICGVVGFRTSAGRVPQYPAGWLYDWSAVAGPMARTVADTALMLSVLAGPDARVPISLSEPGEVFADAARGEVAGQRIAWSRDLGVAVVEPEVVNVVESALGTWRSLGCAVEADQPDFADIRDIITPLRAVRMAAQHQDLLELGDKIDNKFFKDFVQVAKRLSLLDVARAEALRSRLWERVHAFFQRYDFLVSPTTQTPAFDLEKPYPDVIAGRQIENNVDAFLLTYAISLTGLPAISIPCGFTAAGLPVGMQIVGRWRDEAGVLRAAAAFERAAPWAHLRPPVVAGGS